MCVLAPRSKQFTPGKHSGLAGKFSQLLCVSVARCRMACWVRIGEWEHTWFSFRDSLGPSSPLLVCLWLLHPGNLQNGNRAHDYLTAVPQPSPADDSMTATQSMLLIDIEQSSLEGLLWARSWAGDAVMNKRDLVLSLRRAAWAWPQVFLHLGCWATSQVALGTPQLETP